MTGYRLLRRLLRLAVRIFFRRIEVVGLEHVPNEGEAGVVFCGNHPNSLLDPIMVTVFCGRIVHFAAKDVLFRSRFLRFFLKMFGAVPLQRRKDHPDGPLDNESAFGALYSVLGAGRAMGIFPEGISHNNSQLSELKTGAARIALGAGQAFPALPIVLVPVGLTYVHRHRFRSSVLVQFGPAIPLSEPLRDAYRRDAKETVKDLTQEVALSLRALTVNATDWETLRVLDGVRRLYQPREISLEARVELARRFNAVYPSVQERPQVRALYLLVESYLDRLADLGLSDRDLSHPLSAGAIITKVARYLALLLFWLPLGAVGALLHIPLALLLGWGGERFAPRKDVVGTTKFIIGFFLSLLVYVGLAAYAGLTLHWAMGPALIFGLPLSGYATLRVIERAHAIRNAVSVAGRLFHLRDTIGALTLERAALERQVVEAVHAFIPDEMEPLFPREVP